VAGEVAAAGEAAAEVGTTEAVRARLDIPSLYARTHAREPGAGQIRPRSPARWPPGAEGYCTGCSSGGRT
jgi:hypothetical protein